MKQQFFLLSVCLALAACTTTQQSASPSIDAGNGAGTPVPTLIPTLPNQSTAPTQTASIVPDTGWISGDNGVELRRLQGAGAGTTSATVVVARLDPASVRLRVGYAPGEPRPLRDWAGDDTTLLVVNGGYFDEQFRSTALVISDGAASGESYSGFGGMLGVAPDGAVWLRYLRDTPFDGSEALDQAMQSAPMLVLPGGVAAEINDDGDRARRTVLALDQSGRVLVIVWPNSSPTLRETTEWLLSSDLAIDRALNMDGGSSTGLYVHAGAASVEVDPFTRLPLVLLAERR